MKTQGRTQGKLVIQVQGGDSIGICLADPPESGGMWIDVKMLDYNTMKANAEYLALCWNNYEEVVDILLEAVAWVEPGLIDQKNKAFVQNQIALLPAWISKARAILNNASK